MKKVLLSLALLACALCAGAQNIQMGEEIPAEAAQVLQPRLVQMLEAAGVADAPLQASAAVTQRMETPGSNSQVALTIELTLRSGAVKEVFTLKGVGEGEADAWQRAAKQFLPRSKAAQSFAQKLK